MSNKGEKRSSFCLLVSLLTKEYIDGIISAFVKLNYTVGPLDNIRCYIHDEKIVGTILQLSLGRILSPTEEQSDDMMVPLTVVMEDVIDILTISKSKYFMVWLAAPAARCAWKMGNIKIENRQSIDDKDALDPLTHPLPRCC